MSQTTLILGVLRGSAPANTPNKSRSFYTEQVDVTIPPKTPLRVGARVKVYTIEEISDPFGRAQDDETRKTYQAEPLGVEGRITGVRMMEREVTEFVVSNENPRSATAHAYLTIKHEQGKTVNFELWRRILRWLMLPMLETTRWIPMEDGALVLDKANLPSTAEERIGYGDSSGVSYNGGREDA
ncbi:uncharacterized protein TRAVEDRAFT_51089 [Trametes versicolor FP-101664 SS1]|uniref:uncharacterized protein n=1 Tax=Trametes versicolor (strain FP-101664) TaxID=717944 RepID=UPI0004623EA5|nr:uncharacterized protein TRAVEDRAFT_51089 [Trametes versicolor FP-101664 SS1]EIW54959.1 hypothetical protein TRAVEDRAFT_51089 [Trametes versicolor FP-101664 SS1]